MLFKTLKLLVFIFVIVQSQDEQEDSLDIPLQPEPDNNQEYVRSGCDDGCHKDSQCLPVTSNKYCCKCNEGFIGNGVNCFLASNINCFLFKIYNSILFFYSKMIWLKFEEKLLEILMVLN